MRLQISVIIPTLKRPGILTRCLTAVNEQAFPREEYEVIVVTDGPDQVTMTEVLHFAGQYPSSNISCAELPLKAGPAAARNKGVALSKGELIVFTDDDCIPDKHWLRHYWNSFCIENRKEIAFTGKTIVPHPAVPTDYEKNIAGLQSAEFITANCACTKKVFERVGGFDEDFPAAWREDSELQFRLIAASVPIIRVNTAIVVHPVRKAPWGISIKEQRKSMYNALLHKKHPRLYKERISSKPLWNYYAIVFTAFIAVISSMSHKPQLALASLSCCIVLIAAFASKRLKNTSKKTGHVIEMIATSMIIPFLSVFWTLYGSFSYKKLLL